RNGATRTANGGVGTAPKPFFIYAAFTAPHANNESHLCEVPDLGIYKDKDWPEPEKLKAALITRLDRYVGDIMAKLHERGLDENTLVIFTSDNGPHEEGSNKAAFDKASGPLRGIKRDVYEGGDREPFIARWPGHIAANSETAQPIAFWDFMPTAMELAGPPGSGIGVSPMGAATASDGISFLPTLLGHPENQKQHDYFYWEFHENGFHQALILLQNALGNAGSPDYIERKQAGPMWKGVRHGLNAPIELYNLNEDVGEKKDVAREHPEVVARMAEYFSKCRTESAEFPVK
ncbi:MAG TPA: sulfatase-like hydrolase/transferase, partial [Phycisphaerae bacterium]|nr:sulfatase-like hydrolase/transferase [Phycisphaerae bacterium]